MKSFLPEDVYAYILQHNEPNLPKLVKSRIDYTNSLHNAYLLTNLEQIKFIGELANIIACKKYLEIGVFTGVTALNIALNTDNAEIFLIDHKQSYIDSISEFFRENNLPNKLIPRVGAGVSIMEDMLEQHQDSFDLIYVDANKSDYIKYYNLAKKLIRINGVILIDNVLMHAQVLQDIPNHKYVNKIKELNSIIAHDRDVSSVMMPFGDGLTMVRRVY